MEGTLLPSVELLNEINDNGLRLRIVRSAYMVNRDPDAVADAERNSDELARILEAAKESYVSLSATEEECLVYENLKKFLMNI